MNLVAYEYIATQQKRHGVLVLSEFAGAAQSLNGSIIVNPWNTEELAGAYQEAVTMSDEHRALNFAKLDRYVSKYTRYVTLSLPSSHPVSFVSRIWFPTDHSLAHSGANPSSPNSSGYQPTLPISSNPRNWRKRIRAKDMCHPKRTRNNLFMFLFRDMLFPVSWCPAVGTGISNETRWPSRTWMRRNVFS